MVIHEIESDGKKFKFNVLNNFTEPCPDCGVPACGKEDVVWYEDNGQRFAIIFDGGYFDLAIEECIGINIDLLKNGSLPAFLNEWNESTGWVDCWDYTGYKLETLDFLESLDLIQNCGLDKWVTKKQINDLKTMAQEALVKGLTLKITRG